MGNKILTQEEWKALVMASYDKGLLEAARLADKRAQAFDEAYQPLLDFAQMLREITKDKPFDPR